MKIVMNFAAAFGAALTLSLCPLRANTLEGLPGTLFSPMAQTLGPMQLAISVGIFGHQDGTMILGNRFLFQELNKGGDPDTALVQDLQSGMLRTNIALGIGKYFDLGLSIPMYADFIDDTRAKDLSGKGLGDIALLIKAGRSLTGDHLFDAAFSSSVTIPSKNENGFMPKQFGFVHDDSLNRDAIYFSSNGVGVSGQAIFTLDLSRLETRPPFRASINAGVSQSGAGGTSPIVLLGGGLEWMPIPALEFFANLQTETRQNQLGQLGEIGKEYSFAAFGFSANSDDGIFFSVAVQKSLPNRPSHTFSKTLPDGLFTYATNYQPSYGLAVNIGWSGALITVDSDHDGSPDKEDQCVSEPEDKDDFQDFDGCPEIDNDGDGHFDAVDKCPSEPEDKDGFQDEDGCPELDNDKDRIPDLKDTCPNEPEDLDGFTDYDGCPDLDNDQDGIMDIVDKCSSSAEDSDGFQDADGCPDPDNDKDGILDINDKCINDSETFNGYQDDDGCADNFNNGSTPPNNLQTLIPLAKRTLLRQVQFKPNGSQLLPDAYTALDTLAKRILLTPGLIVEVRAYMDGAGSESESQKISETRAAAVREYLISKGLSGDKIIPRGMGSRDPITTNRTAAGRTQNRRIEIHRLD